MPQVMPWEEYSSTPSDAGGGQGVVIPNAPKDMAAEQRAETGTQLNVQGEARAGRKDVRDAVLDLQDRFRRDENVKKYEGALPNYVAALKTQPTTSGDTALVYHFAKTVDPTNTVGTGDMENIQATDARLPSLAQKWLTELRLSDGKFTDRAREGLRAELRQILQQREQSYMGARDLYAELAQAPEFGVRPELVIGKTPFGERFKADIDSYWSKRDEAGAAPQQLGLEAGATFSTEQDKAIRDATQQAWQSGADLQGIVAAAQAAGGKITPNDIANIQAAIEARAKGQSVTFNPAQTGQRSPVAQAAGEFLMTPAGTALTGAANAASVGLLSQFAGDQVQGLEALNPNAALVGELAGSIAGTAGLAKGGAAALRMAAPGIAERVAGGGLAGAIGREALTEGAYGGLYAANTGQDIGTGLALGAAGSLGGRALGAAARRVAPTVGRMLGREGGNIPPDGGVPPGGADMGGMPPAGGGMPPVAGAPAGASMAGGIDQMAAQAEEPFAPITFRSNDAGSAGVTDEGIRVNRARELPVPVELAKFQRSRLFEEQQRARELAKNNEVGGPIRDLLRSQQEALRQNFDAFLDRTGSKEWGNRREQGIVVDTALRTLAKRMDNRVNALYKRAEKAGELAEPVDMSGLADELNILRAERTAAPVITGLADELAVRELATGSLANGTLKMKRPLTLNEAEELRKKINRVAKQNDPNDLRVAGELKGIIDGLTEGAGGTAYKAARAARKEVGDKFERIGAVKKLMGFKPGTTDRQIALENVVETAITSGSTSLDDIKGLKSVLDEAGPRGQRAWRELQGATIEEIQRKAYRSQTDESGQKVLYPSQLEAAITALDKGGKLDFVFGTKTAELLRTMGEVSKDLFTAPPGSVNSSNTGSAITNALDTLVTFSLAGAPVPAGKVANEFFKSLRTRGLRQEVNRLIELPKE